MENRSQNRRLSKVDAKGQGGMLDVALDPDFTTNSIIYFSFSEPFGKGPNICGKRKTVWRS
jgi:glucose/arabinose dehydrogenase